MYKITVFFAIILKKLSKKVTHITYDKENIGPRLSERDREAFFFNLFLEYSLKYNIFANQYKIS